MQLLLPLLQVYLRRELLLLLGLAMPVLLHPVRYLLLHQDARQLQREMCQPYHPGKTLLCLPACFMPVLTALWTLLNSCSSYFVANVSAEAADRAAHHAANISHPETNPRAHTAHQEPHRDAHGDTNVQPHTAAKPAADCCSHTHADAEADVQPYASTDALAQTRTQGLQGTCRLAPLIST